MILDSSAIAAILLHQRGADRLVESIATAELLTVAEPTLLETAIVITARLGDRARFLALDFVRESGAEVLPFEEVHLSAAIDAYLRYGKGRHAAALNFGDCIAYATARVTRQPLLFVGADFAKTDIQAALT